MLAGWLVPGHLIRGHLTWCPRLWNSRGRECLVPGAWRVSRTLGGEEPCKRAWVGCQMRKAVQHLLVCAKSSVSTRRVGPFVRSSCGNRPAACTQTARSALAARGCPSACRAGLSKRLPRGGSFSTCCAGSCVSARPGPPAVRLYRPGPPVQGPLNAPDWLAGQHADRAWPTRRRGIRMPWWCWPAGRSPCCSPRQWPPGNESPCLIPRQR